MNPIVPSVKKVSKLPPLCHIFQTDEACTFKGPHRHYDAQRSFSSVSEKPVGESEDQESHTLSAVGEMDREDHPKSPDRWTIPRPPARATKSRPARARHVTPFRARLAKLKLFPELKLDASDKRA
ncbi:hypothetical protein VNI00_011677 [Paramarasmius palmivorus]|uniref:Uncharacterized protein n=1 Tax=Paramarasmius palmivorus TaxID=297713 RepID=A0AAW0CAZ8_9AGAR